MSSLPPTEWWRPQPLTGPERPEAVAFDSAIPRGGLAFRALLAFTFVLLLAPQAFLPALRPFRIALLTAGAAILAQLIESVVLGRALTVLSREMVLTAALVGWAVVTMPLSYWPGGSVSFLLDFYLKTLAIFWLLANTVDSVSRLRTLAVGLSAMAVPLALTAVKNFLSGTFIEGATPNGDNRIVGYEGGLTANPNDLALMLNLLLPLSLALLATARNTLSRALLVVLVVLATAGVVVTFSRGGFFTLATVIALHLWRLARRGAAGWALAGLVTCLASASVVPEGYLARLGTSLDIDADTTGSAQTRWNDSVVAATFVLAHPVIGAGAGMSTLALNEARGATWLNVHNVYLEYAVDLGLPGLTLFVVLFVSCLAKARRVRQRAAARGLRELSCLAEGVEISLLAFAVAAMFHPVAYHFYFFYPAGLAVAVGGIYRNLVPTDDQPLIAVAS